MNTSEAELLAIEAALRETDEQQIFRMARFDDLVAQIVARKADGAVDAWRDYLNGELKALGFSNAEILAGINRLGLRACEG